MLSGCGGTSTLAGGGNLDPRWLSMSGSHSATRQWGWGFHTVRGGINPGILRFRPQVVRFVDILKNSLSGDET